MSKSKKYLNDISLFQRNRKGQPSNIYFIMTQVSKTQGHLNRVKIGYTSNVKHRLKSLQTGNPYELKLWYSFEIDDKDAIKLESNLHGKFRHCRTIGEWFIVKPYIREWIKEHKRLSRKPNIIKTILRKKDVRKIRAELEEKTEEYYNAIELSKRQTEASKHTKMLD